MEALADTVRLRGHRLRFRMVDIVDGQIQLIIMLLYFTAVLGAPVGQYSQRRQPLSLIERQYRLYHLRGLGVKRRQRRKGLATERLPLLHPAAPNLTWSMDFVMDALATGRRIKCLTCVDDFTKECLTITIAFGISGVQVTRILDSIALFRGYPATIRTDQGPEFTCRALDQWAFEHGVELCQRQDLWPFFAIFNVRYLITSAVRFPPFHHHRLALRF